MEHEPAPDHLLARIDALGLRVPLHVASLLDLLREEVDEPLGLDRAGEPHEHPSTGPLRSLLRVERYHPLRVAHDAGLAELCRSTAAHRELPSTPSHALGNAIRVPAQHRQPQRFIRRPTLPPSRVPVFLSTPSPRAALQLLRRPGHGMRRPCVEARRTERARGEA